ncbi:MAG: type II toxin-antitoxin system RelE/ParE family toxin [bacterium]
MIKSFLCKETEKIFSRKFSRKFPKNLQKIAYRKLLLIESAERLDDLRIPPGNRIEKLSGKREGQHSIRINDQWRVCSRWQMGDAYEVEIADYH